MNDEHGRFPAIIGANVLMLASGPLIVFALTVVAAPLSYLLAALGVGGFIAGRYLLRGALKDLASDITAQQGELQAEQFRVARRRITAITFCGVVLVALVIFLVVTRVL